MSKQTEHKQKETTLTELKQKEQNILKELQEVRTQRQIVDAQILDKEINEQRIVITNVEQRLTNRKQDLTKIMETIKQIEKDIVNIELDLTKEQEILKTIETKLKTSEIRNVRFTYIDNNGKQHIVYGEKEFRDLVHKERSNDMVRFAQPPTTNGSSSFNSRWTACGKQVAIEKATQIAIKKLEDNNLSIPKKYHNDMVPTIDCYSG